MQFTSETASDGVVEHPFVHDDVPGVVWSPANPSGPCPLVLLGHGGGQHKLGASCCRPAGRAGGCPVQRSDGVASCSRVAQRP